jgi:lysophospholipase L1-like esterase
MLPLAISPRYKKTYAEFMKAMFSSSLIGYWPLNESAGSIAVDYSGNGRHGVYTGSFLAGATNPVTNQPAPYWDGANGKFVSILTAISPYLTLDEGAVGMMCSADAGVSVSTTERTLFMYSSTGGNFIVLGHRAATYSWGAHRRRIAVYDSFNSFNSFYDNNWNTVLFTWSKANSILKVYINGNEIISSAISTSEVITSPNVGLIGASGASTGAWKGSISDFFAVSRYVTPAEALNHYQAKTPYLQTFGILGDSITAQTSTSSFVNLLSSSYLDGRIKIKNHAVDGQAIISNMDTQTVASANDNANIIIIELGTNDNNAGNMTTLQAEAEENIAELKASNPNATIYWLNVLPRWTNASGVTPVDKANVRTAIAAACTAQSITCWDTFTTPWITAALTSDGLHPTAAGHIAIFEEILARL